MAKPRAEDGQVPKVELRDYPLVLAMQAKAEEELRFWTQVRNQFEADQGDSSFEEQARVDEFLGLLQGGKGSTNQEEDTWDEKLFPNVVRDKNA